jgi:hypothetical protein
MCKLASRSFVGGVECAGRKGFFAWKWRGSGILKFIEKLFGVAGRSCCAGCDSGYGNPASDKHLAEGLRREFGGVFDGQGKVNAFAVYGRVP